LKRSPSKESLSRKNTTHNEEISRKNVINNFLIPGEEKLRHAVENLSLIKQDYQTKTRVIKDFNP